jgi:hypothetical protein
VIIVGQVALRIQSVTASILRRILTFGEAIVSPALFSKVVSLAAQYV